MTGDARAARRRTRLALRATWQPLLQRFRVHEGLLLAALASLVVVARPAPGRGLAELVLGVWLLALLYAYNDVHDAPRDTGDPKKDPALVAHLYADRAWLRGWILAQTGAVALLAGTLLGTGALVATAAVAGLNVAYSHRLKGVPVLDVLTVGLWGAAYVTLVQPPVALCVLIGAMTAISHVFQTLRDRRADADGGVHTVGQLTEGGVAMVLLGASAVLFAVLLPLGWPLAASAAFPLVAWWAIRRPVPAWLVVKAYFAAVWVVALVVHP